MDIQFRYRIATPSSYFSFITLSFIWKPCVNCLSLWIMNNFMIFLKCQNSSKQIYLKKLYIFYKLIWSFFYNNKLSHGEKIKNTFIHLQRCLYIPTYMYIYRVIKNMVVTSKQFFHYLGIRIFQIMLSWDNLHISKWKILYISLFQITSKFSD